jgi:hypothetical protein
VTGGSETDVGDGGIEAVEYNDDADELMEQEGEDGNGELLQKQDRLSWSNEQ